MTENNDLIKELNSDLPVLIPVESSSAQIKEVLIASINELIAKDLNQLLNILYRLDVSESRLRQMLKEHEQEDAATIVAALIIERQLKKIKSRREYSRKDDKIDENERW
jgi:hypothetical protein